MKQGIEQTSNALDICRASEANPDVMRICPRDGSPLMLHQQGRARLHSCESCNGLWIPSEHFKQWVERPPLVQTISPRPTEGTIKPCEPTKMLCPECRQTRLLSCKVDRIDVDICPTCKGLWLDSGELEAIVRRHKRRRTSMSWNGDRRSLVVDCLDGALDLATSAIDAGDLLEVVAHAIEGIPELAGEAAGAVLEFIFEILGSIF